MVKELGRYYSKLVVSSQCGRITLQKRATTQDRILLDPCPHEGDFHPCTV